MGILALTVLAEHQETSVALAAKLTLGILIVLALLTEYIPLVFLES